MHPVAARRILRLSLGTALCLAFSQIVAWPLSFIAPALVIVVLSLPLPPQGFKKSLVFVMAMMAPMVAGMGLLPLLEHARSSGILLTALALFYTFYYTARGGSPVLGTFMTVGLTVIVTIGSVSSTLLAQLIPGLGLGAAVAMFFVALAHWLLPDLPAPELKPPAPAKPSPRAAARMALRSLLIVLPLVLLFLFMSGSPAYTVVMIKVASMGQQASSDKSRAMGRSLLLSTLWGGIGAIIAWELLRIWPSLLFYVLLLALAGLAYGRFIFKGVAVHPWSQTTSYALLTLLVILAPAVLDGPGSSGAGSAFWTRLGLFVLIAIYGTVSVAVFDAFWPEKPDPQNRNPALANRRARSTENATKMTAQGTQTQES
jgi:hypothetical protein